jgi:hypothetical protein
MDNLGSHKGAAVRQAIRAAGARLFFLPKYSPDLNPIEQLFSKIKHWLRKASARTRDALSDATGHILESVTSDECANYLKAGYAPPKPIMLSADAPNASAFDPALPGRRGSQTRRVTAIGTAKGSVLRDSPLLGRAVCSPAGLHAHGRVWLPRRRAASSRRVAGWSR